MGGIVAPGGIEDEKFYGARAFNFLPFAFQADMKPSASRNKV